MFKSDYFPNEKAFRAILPGKIALVCERIADEGNVEPMEALVQFYQSPAYAELEVESTKRWWESPAELYRDWKAGV